MIQIQSTLSCEPVFIAGDVIECIISFKNISQQCESTAPELLAWASAQLHCYCLLNETKLKSLTAKPPANALRCDQLVTGSTSKETSFVPNQGERGFIIYSSQPTILLCDLQLLPGDVKTLVYRESLPSNLPPSYNGQMVRYIYKISIGMQKINAGSKLIKIPLKVFRLPDDVMQLISKDLAGVKSISGQPVLKSGSNLPKPSCQAVVEKPLSPSGNAKVLPCNSGTKNDSINKEGSSTCNNEADGKEANSDLILLPPAMRNPSSLNPFLDAPPTLSLADRAISHLEDLSAARQPSYFNITQGKHHVTRFCLLKANFCLGEDIVGTFDFSGATVCCAQFSVTLQSIEKMVGEGEEKLAQANVVSYSKAHEVCMFLRQTHIALPVPVHVAPSFETDIVTLSWRLHFEFVMAPDFHVSSMPPPHFASGETHLDWRPPDELNVQSMTWNLPIRILPTSSAHVAAHLNLQREFYAVL